MGCCCPKQRGKAEARPLLQRRNSFEQRYEMQEDSIGIGTTSVVHICHQRAPALYGVHARRALACKVVDKRKLGLDVRVRTVLLEQLRQEITVLKKLNHRNVIRLIDVCEQPEKVYIVMELMHGGELFDCIVQKGRFTESEAYDVVR